MTREEAAKAINDLLSDRVGIDAYIEARDLESYMSVDDLERIYDIERNINEHSDIIYYHNAIDFLKKNDPSLSTACELAADMGYRLKDVTSEILASILNNQYMNDAYYDCRDEIQDILDDIEDKD